MVGSDLHIPNDHRRQLRCGRLPGSLGPGIFGPLLILLCLGTISPALSIGGLDPGRTGTATAELIPVFEVAIDTSATENGSLTPNSTPPISIVISNHGISDQRVEYEVHLADPNSTITQLENGTTTVPAVDEVSIPIAFTISADAHDGEMYMIEARITADSRGRVYTDSEWVQLVVCAPKLAIPSVGSNAYPYDSLRPGEAVTVTTVVENVGTVATPPAMVACNWTLSIADETVQNGSATIQAALEPGEKTRIRLSCSLPEANTSAFAVGPVTVTVSVCRNGRAGECVECEGQIGILRAIDADGDRSSRYAYNDHEPEPDPDNSYESLSIVMFVAVKVTIFSAIAAVIIAIIRSQLP